MSRSKKSEIMKKLIEFIKKEGGISVGVASEMFGISEVTARRYLNEIASMETLPVRRVRGGIILETGKGSVEFMFETKLSMNLEEKKRIAKKALEFIEDGDSLILDSGTTTYQLARLLGRRKGLKVITVDVKVAEEAAKSPENEVYIVGGKVRAGYFSVGGEMAIEMLEMFRVEKVFLSADAVHPKYGITNSSTFEAKVKETISRLGKKTVLLADHTKIGKVAFVRAVPVERIDYLITTEGADESVLRELEEIGIVVIKV